VLSVLVGVIMSAYTSSTDPRAAEAALIVGPGVGLLILVVTSSLFWSSRQGKVRELTRIVNNLPFGGSEVVLDLGCGRGVATVMAAKKLEAGIALGVDMWSKARISGNSPQSVLANASYEGLGNRVAAVKGSSTHLPLVDSSVDIILSGLAIHHLVPRRQRNALFAEMARVLKDGGRIGILDAGNGNEYASILTGIGLRDIEMHRLRFSSFPPFHVVMARKPYSE